MINQPQLVKQQAAFTAEPDLDVAQENKVKVSSTAGADTNQGNAKFIMGLNNRIAKQEQRLDNIERHLKQSLQQSSKQLNQHSIGYKELGLTLALSLLIFTSLGFFFTNQTPIDSKLLKQLLAPTPIKAGLTTKVDGAMESTQNLATKQNLPLLSNPTHSISDKPIFSHAEYKWPLEKQRKLKETNYSTHKHGININAKLGDPVVAIERGTVIFSDDNIANYGNLILVQHPNNIISVYGNNYSNYVKKGQSIRKGELLAAVGETSGNQPRLYFEIRYKGKAQDPFLYYK